MMKTIFLVVASAALAAAQQNGEVLLQQDFEGQLSGWMTMNPSAAVRLDKEPSHAHAGSGSLAFSYEIKPRQVAAAVMPAPPALARMQRLRFWLKTDHATAVAVLLNEIKPGGNYNAIVWSPANTWQEVELAPTDFFLADGPNDPKDADGKLDLDRLQGVGLIDMAALFPPLAAASSGAHTLWLDDFEALGGELASASETQPSLCVDSFNRGYLAWLSTTGADLKRRPADNPLNEAAMETSYEQTEEPFPSFVRRINLQGMAQATRLEFDIASEKEATINVSLEMSRSGLPQAPRFNLPIYPPASREVFPVSLKLADFQGQGKLDPAQLKTLILTDISAAQSGTLGRNTIWVGNVRFR